MAGRPSPMTPHSTPAASAYPTDGRRASGAVNASAHANTAKCNVNDAGTVTIRISTG